MPLKVESINEFVEDLLSKIYKVHRKKNHLNKFIFLGLYFHLPAVHAVGFLCLFILWLFSHHHLIHNQAGEISELVF